MATPTSAAVPLGAVTLFAATFAALGVGYAADRAAAGDGDRLGASRLFFSAAQRGTAVAREADDRDGTDAGRGALAGEAIGVSPTIVTRDGEGDGKGGGEGDEGDGEGEARSNALASAPRVRFEALLRVGERVQLLVDGRPCRLAERAPVPGGDEVTVRCPAPPPGVRSLALSMHDGALLVTLPDGRRRRLDVGEALWP